MPRRKTRRATRILALVVRRWLRRLDRQTPGWARDLTPWGTSLTLHALTLMLLAIIFWADRAGGDSEKAIESRLVPQLIDDLTTIAPSERSGDPFTSLDAVDPPSLTIDPAEADPAASASPEFAELSPFGGGSRPATRAGGSRAVAKHFLGGVLDLPSVPFSGRQGPVRARLVRREGGTVESERAVERGLDWIARHQRDDGSWGLDTQPECRGNGCRGSKSASSDTGATGLALLPLLGAGHSPTHPGRYQKALERGLGWLVAHQKVDGDLFTGGNPNVALYSHAIGTMALCEALGVTGDETYREPGRRAVAFIVASQSAEDGGWRYVPGQSGDTSVLGWQVLALRSARLAGLEVPDPTLVAASAFLDRVAIDDKKTLYSYQPGNRPSLVLTSEALLVRQYLGWPRDHPALVAGRDRVAADLAELRERNVYYWYYAMQFLHNMKGDSWERVNPRVRNAILRLQVEGRGCDRGSWDPARPRPDRWGSSIGRLYATSLSLLTLEVYYRYLPLYRDDPNGAW